MVVFEGTSTTVLVKGGGKRVCPFGMTERGIADTALAYAVKLCKDKRRVARQRELNIMAARM